MLIYSWVGFHYEMLSARITLRYPGVEEEGKEDSSDAPDKDAQFRGKLMPDASKNIIHHLPMALVREGHYHPAGHRAVRDRH